MRLFVVLKRALLLIPFLANFAFKRKQVMTTDSVGLKGVEGGELTFTVIYITLVRCLLVCSLISSCPVLTHSGMLMKTSSRWKDFLTIVTWEGSLMVF